MALNGKQLTRFRDILQGELAALQEDDTLARIGGSEFGYCLVCVEETLRIRHDPKPKAATCVPWAG